MDSTPINTQPDRRLVGIRLSTTKVDHYDQLAHDNSHAGHRLTRTDVIKAHLAVAERHTDEVKALLRKMGEAR